MAALAAIPTATLTPAPPRAESLYTVQELLDAFLDSAELVTPEQQAEFDRQLANVLQVSAEQIDRAERYLRFCESNRDFAAAEINRLTERKRRYEAALEHAKDSIVRVVQQLGCDAKGKYKRLEGTVVRFRIQPNPESLDDEAVEPEQIPAAYKTVILQMPAETWERILDLLDIEESAVIRGQVKETVSLRRDAIKAALKAGNAVPGACLASARTFHLRRD